LINICIHGHFYQPPRENPWTGEIEKQDSAFPYHDWNERVYTECYKTNASASVLDDEGKILQNVNNYLYLNFNFGPTLLSWIKNKHYDTYKMIVEADRESIPLHNGHGNAIAMAYNHMILPLANRRDKITQVRWGLKDFSFHFRREAESIWLPETACNTQTLEVLIEEKIKYIILDVSQAESIRKIGDKNWTDVSHNNIDPKLTYRCFSESDNNKFIDIIFYDGPISKSIAFESTLASSEELLDKILQAVPQDENGDILISAAADGETFGHHKKFAERTLAYFMTHLAPENELKIVNFSEYLAGHPPEFEVKIKQGKNGEGTSWSCPHGVDRWKDDCGCGRVGGWHQRWRKPLRESLDNLRDKMIQIFEEHGNKYFSDVWKARDEYIELILDNSDENRYKFFNSNAARVLSKEELDKCFTLLEMQKYAMFMFTSCGWFFSEISGIEAVKILEYASRAIQLAENITGVSLENEFLTGLSKAESNVKGYRNGRGVYEKLVKTARRKVITQVNNNEI
jgi:alpha-amylase/alpha-mannosidase (GH57 family)